MAKSNIVQIFKFICKFMHVVLNNFYHNMRKIPYCTYTHFSDIQILAALAVKPKH